MTIWDYPFYYAWCFSLKSLRFYIEILALTCCTFKKLVAEKRYIEQQVNRTTVQSCVQLYFEALHNCTEQGRTYVHTVLHSYTQHMYVLYVNRTVQTM